MANTYNWRINALDAKIHEGDNDNVIYTVHWSFIATDETEEHVASSIGTHNVEYDADNFTAYEDITEEMVIGWLEAGLDVDSMKEGLDKQIEKLITPTETTFHNPFPKIVEETPSEETPSEETPSEETP